MRKVLSTPHPVLLNGATEVYKIWQARRRRVRAWTNYRDFKLLPRCQEWLS